MWKGTALTLKAMPASTKTMPKSWPVLDPAREALRDPAELGGAGEAVEQRDAVEQDPGGESAQHEIFEARLGRARVAALEAGEDVGGEALELEADIEGEEIAGRDHHPHADRGEEDQHRIFGAIVPVAAEPAHRHQHGDAARRCR